MFGVHACDEAQVGAYLPECTEVRCDRLDDLQVDLEQCVAQLFYDAITQYDRVILPKNDVLGNRHGVR